MGANGAALSASKIEMSLSEAKQIEAQAQRAYAYFSGALRMETATGSLGAEGTLTFVLINEGNRWLIDTLSGAVHGRRWAERAIRLMPALGLN